MSFIRSMLAAAERARAGLSPDAPSFGDGLYILVSADLLREHAARRAARGQANYADALLVEVAEAIELRHEKNRRAEGEQELRATLQTIVHVAEAWIEAIDRRGEE